jgi:hypothetical protein
MSGCRNRQDLTFQYPCSVGSPRFARGTKPQGSPCTQGEPEVCHFNIPTPTPPLNNKTPIGYPYPYYDKQQTSQDRQPMGNTTTHT